jgi:hypothetical protein
MNSLTGDSSSPKEFQMANGKEQTANEKQFEFCSRFAGPSAI